jgi:hypothetical protein
MRNKAMRSIYIRSAVLGGIFAAVAMVAGPALAAQNTPTERCQDLAMQFKMIDVRHMSPDKLESARRQANHGEKLCRSEPEIGVKALDLAFKEIGVSPK